MSEEGKPAGWEKCRLDDVAQLVRGITFPTTVKGHEPKEGAVACLRTANVQAEVEWDDLWYVPRQYVKHDEQYVRGGDVLISTANSYELVGKVARVKAPHEEASLGAFISLLRAEAGVSDTFFYYLMSSDFIQRTIRDMASTTTNLSNVSGSKLKELELPIAPSAEQTRIVEKLEELLSDLDAGVAELKAAQRKLAQYRQSLLKAAVEGALTADWRAGRRESEKPPRSSSRRKPGSSALANSKSQSLDPGFRRDDGNSETGVDLLQRILTERRARWEARQLAKFAEQGKIPPKDWKAKYPSPVAPDTTDLPALPDGWVWASLDQLVAESSYGTSVKCSYEGDGVPVLRIPNVASRTIDLSNLKFSTEPLKLESTDYLAEGDILFVRTNGSIGLVGRAAEVRSISDRNLYFASYLLRVRCTETDTVPGWISAFVASDFGRRWIERRAASSAGQHNISLSTLLKIHVPFPGLAEQRRALEALGVALEGAAEQESAVETALLQSAAQRKNILKAAFAGQLVPQDPNDEPASALLERIRAERVSGSAKRSGKTGRKLREQA